MWLIKSTLTKLTVNCYVNQLKQKSVIYTYQLHKQINQNLKAIDKQFIFLFHNSSSPSCSSSYSSSSSSPSLPVAPFSYYRLSKNLLTFSLSGASSLMKSFSLSFWPQSVLTYVCTLFSIYCLLSISSFSYLILFWLIVIYSSFSPSCFCTYHRKNIKLKT